MHTHTSPYRWLYLLAALISLILMIWSAKWGYAEILAITPRHNISQWETNANTLDQQSAKESWGRLQKAIILNSNNAEFYMDLARLATLQANTLEATPQDQQQYQTLAIHNLKQTLKRRPTWGLAWAKLAQSYIDTTENRDAFINALEKAVHFEPYEIQNQQQVIPLGIAHWEILPEKLKIDFKNLVKETLRYHRKLAPSTIQIAVTHNWTTELTPLIQHKQQHQLLEKEIMRKNRPS